MERDLYCCWLLVGFLIFKATCATVKMSICLRPESMGGSLPYKQGWALGSRSPASLSVYPYKCVWCMERLLGFECEGEQCGNRLGTQSLKERDRERERSGAKVVPLKRALKAQKFLANGRHATATEATRFVVSYFRALVPEWSSAHVKNLLLTHWKANLPTHAPRHRTKK